MRFLLVPLFLLLFSAAGLCDVVELTNGDRLTGVLKSLAGGRLAFDTPYAGQLSIDWKQVRSVETTGEYEVDLMSGQTVIGAIVPVQAGEYRIGALRGPTALAGEIAGIRTPPESQDGFLSNWQATADLGYTTTRGNDHTTQLAFQFQPQRRQARDSLKADLQSLRSLTGGSGTNTHSLETRYDRFVSGRLFFFIVGKGEHNQQESLQLRTREGGGVGLRFRAGGGTQLSTLTGVTFVQERFKREDYQFSGEGLLGYEFETRAFTPLRITSKGQILPSFAEPGRFRSEWDTGIRVPFAGGTTFGVRLFHRFNSNPTAGARKADYGLISTIGVTF